MYNIIIVGSSRSGGGAKIDDCHSSIVVVAVVASPNTKHYIGGVRSAVASRSRGMGMITVVS